MPFREMRRFGQQLSQEKCLDILDRNTSGVLAVTGDQGWPYAVPLSYVRVGETLIFHCATAGHKLDALRREPRASFCVIDQDQILPERYTTAYRSVIVFGSVRILEGTEARQGAEALGRKYHPTGTPQALAAEIDGSQGRLRVLELSISHMTGKRGREATD